MSVDPAFLAKISLFAPLDDDERAVLAQAMVGRQVKPGEVLFRAGEPGDSMFIVVEGGIELSVKDKAGQKIVLHTPTAGEFFGELSLLDGGSRTATATAAEASSLYVLDREDMLQLFKKRPEAGLDMLGAMGRMTRKANALLQARVSRNVNEAAERKLSLLDRISDVIAAFSGSMVFLILNGVWFVVWTAMNVVPMPWFEPFDPFPFGLLTMIVSLEAIFLSCFVLISQDRQSAKDRVRSDIGSTSRPSSRSRTSTRRPTASTRRCSTGSCGSRKRSASRRSASPAPAAKSRRSRRAHRRCRAPATDDV